MILKPAVLMLLVLLLLTVSAASRAQPPQPAPAPTATEATDPIGPPFEVATVRPSDPSPTAGGWMGFRLAPSGRLSVRGTRLISLVSYAYDAPIGSGSRVEGGPAWADSQSYDIEAKVDESQMAGWEKLSDADHMARVRSMLRALLADRFQLKLHTEMRETPVYALVQAKGGAKLKQVAGPEAVKGEGDERQRAMRSMADHPGKPAPGSIRCSGDGCTGKSMPMKYAIGQIGGNAKAELVVIDQTGLTGYYDFSYTISRDPDAASPMEQIEDQLGLRFESRKIPMKTYVIDSAQQPTEN